jgi:hypothetical protein
MKYKLLFLLFIFLYGTAFAQNPDSVWAKKHYEKKEVYIKMRDGIRLYTAIYMPADLPGKHPILVVRTPYSCAPYGKDEWPSSFWNNYLGAYLKRGYCFVLQDVRGRYMSEGTFVNIRPFNPNKKTNNDIDEASDTYDTIDWLIKNIPGNNGKVGILGTSYPGFYAAMAALSRHPALKAVLPEAPVTDWFMGDDLHHNGAFMLQDAFLFYVQFGFGDPRPKPRSTPDKGLEQPVYDSYKYFLNVGPLPEFTRLTGDSIAFWNELMKHPNYDSWWKARNDRQYMSNIPSNLPTLVVGGLFDAEDSYGTWNLYRAIEKQAENNNRMIIGPWYHGQWSGGKGDHLGDLYWGSNTGEWYIKNIELPFFDHYLRDKGNMDTLAKATVFITGENKWHRFKQWPPVEEKPESLYLNKDKALSFSKPISGFDEYISDPANPVPYTAGVHKDRTREYMDADQRFAEERKDVLTYQTEPLVSDITLTGPLTADLWAAISTTDADFVVKVIDVFPADGNNNSKLNSYEMLVRGDVFRGKFRHSFSKPEPFVPGKPEEIKFTMPDVAHTFKKGHRIMIQVQSSWFPLVDRNPQQFEDIYHARASDFIKSDIRIYHSKDHPSRIILPMVNK